MNIQKNTGGLMTNKLSQIEGRIEVLKKKREKIQIQQALSFTKEAQKILKEDFSTEAALLTLSESWNKASEQQRKEWQKRAPHFRLSDQPSSKKNQLTAEADLEV
jgi:cysteinyl-tRNA synthetase